MIEIGKKGYDLVANPLEDDRRRDAYFALAETVFGLDFGPWYRSGFSGGTFIPYTLFDGEVAVSSVGAMVGEYRLNGETKRCVQLSTAMTDPNYRKKGLNGWLIKHVLGIWRDRCDVIYLYANDSVTGYYPKFGFAVADEYRYSMEVPKREGHVRKLDLSVKADLDLLLGHYERYNNPYSAFAMLANIPMMMFHLVTFLGDCIWYVEDRDAVVVAEMEEDGLTCYDVFTGADCGLPEIIGAVGGGIARLGFVPKETSDMAVEVLNEEDTTVFVLASKENIFDEGRIAFPFLSHA